MSDYQPVSCDLHSALELHILRNEPLWLCWHDRDGSLHRERVIPRDVLTRDGAEFLRVSLDSGEEREIRLDRLAEIKKA